MNINELGALKFKVFKVIFVEAFILENIARKPQSKSTNSYFLMNINDLGAMAMCSRVERLILFFHRSASSLKNIARKLLL